MYDLGIRKVIYTKLPPLLVLTYTHSYSVYVKKKTGIIVRTTHEVPKCNSFDDEYM